MASQPPMNQRLHSNPSVRQERTGWRDEAISARHRMYGWDVPAVDVDFLMVEYDQGKAAGLVEYKAIGARPPRLNHPTYRALCGVADACKIPFAIVFYDSETWVYGVVPVNDYAVALWKVAKIMSEKAYVLSLYRMRKTEPDRRVIAKLNNEISRETFQEFQKVMRGVK